MDNFAFKYQDIVKIKALGVNGIVRGFSIPNNVLDEEIRYAIDRYNAQREFFREDELEFVERQLKLF